MFSPAIANVIFSLPLGNINASDKWLWTRSSSGKFSVKSAYCFFREQLSPSSPTSQPDARSWKQLWNLKIPPRIKHFLWRCCHNALPFADTLARRGVTVDDSCTFCESGPSRATHLFFECPFTCAIWEKARLMSHISSNRHDSVADWFKAVLRLDHTFNAELFAMISYIIWSKRNKSIFEGCVTDVNSIFFAATNLLHDFINANAWPERISSDLEVKIWSKPPRRGWKIYYDGATSRRPAGGIGIYVESVDGTFFRGVSKFYDTLAEPFVVELIALRDALRLAVNLNIRHASIIGDSQQVLLAVGDELEVPCNCRSLLDDIKDLILAAPNLKLFWVRRCFNLVAHELAFHAKMKVDCNESWSSLPDHVLTIRTG